MKSDPMDLSGFPMTEFEMIQVQKKKGLLENLGANSTRDLRETRA